MTDLQIVQAMVGGLAVVNLLALIIIWRRISRVYNNMERLAGVISNLFEQYFINGRGHERAAPARELDRRVTK